MHTAKLTNFTILRNHYHAKLYRSNCLILALRTRHLGGVDDSIINLKRKPTMKTATIKIYHIYGTKNGIAADVTYKGKLLVCFDGHGVQSLKSMARVWARNRSYTHTKVIFG